MEILVTSLTLVAIGLVFFIAGYKMKDWKDPFVLFAMVSTVALVALVVFSFAVFAGAGIAGLFVG